MLRRERHKLLLLASDPGGLATVPENQDRQVTALRKPTVPFPALYKSTHARCREQALWALQHLIYLS